MTSFVEVVAKSASRLRKLVYFHTVGAISVGLYFCVSADGTTIAILADRDGIVVAADSKQINPLEGTHGETCKIVALADNLFFLSAGVSQVTDHGIRVFDLKSLVIGRSLSGTSLRMKWESLRSFVRSALLDLSRTVGAASLSEVERGFIEFALVGLEGGVPTAYAEVITILGRSEKGPFTMKAGSQRRQHIILGRRSAELSFSDNVIRDAYGVVENEVRRQPDRVGGPIHVLLLTSDGASWIRQKPLCDEGGM